MRTEAKKELIDDKIHELQALMKACLRDDKICYMYLNTGGHTCQT